MMVRYLLAALVAGLIAGVFMSVAQEIKVTPLILHAEEFENVGGAHVEQSLAPRGSSILALADFLNPVTSAHAHEGADGGSLFGLDRLGGTILANLVVGAGYGLILLAAVLLTGIPITAKTGVLWGAAGWLTFQFLPALGLPPELPGFPAVDLADRQVWWIATVLLSAAGLYLLVARSEIWAKVLGVVVLALPHVYGAPQPEIISSDVPALLAAEFAVAALATTAFFWVVLGLLMGAAMDRLEEGA
ncbi:CbtA family protein [Hoeflea sp. WL0058]|uniref:CbtA family protein n=1 Tax=Flavimaribacter sediminis TaxID=2865987 RepID=A0AAE2ZJ91_9HYPH|nr:CbtA family protein [Flavimaribacter sediminis]MBW8635986.1 CbtA family protein [Flavimaribacter sediminis]